MVELVKRDGEMRAVTRERRFYVLVQGRRAPIDDYIAKQRDLEAPSTKLSCTEKAFVSQ
jgi:hypothetical protein